MEQTEDKPRFGNDGKDNLAMRAFTFVCIILQMLIVNIYLNVPQGLQQ